MIPRRGFFGQLGGAVAGLFGARAALAKPASCKANLDFSGPVFLGPNLDYATHQLLNPVPMTVERAVKVLNWGKFRDLQWEVSRNEISYELYVSGRFAQGHPNWGPYPRMVYDAFLAICVAEKLEREHLRSVREAALPKYVL